MSVSNIWFSAIEEPVFYVDDLPIWGDTMLAPMAGYSDVPYRAVCRAFGSSMNYTEFVAAEMLLTSKPNRYWRLLDFEADEYPRVMQIFGNDARNLVQAAMRIEGWAPDLIDINMGCSTRRVSGRGAGVGMMRQPTLVAETFRLLKKHLSVPVSGKIRLGWNDLHNYLEIGRILQEEGAAMVAIHPRTKEQKYSGKANWDAIARLKQSLSIPVIGNGDISSPADIDQMLNYTGCDAVMIGRGAIGNPWLLARKQRHELSSGQLFAAVRRHLAKMVSYYEMPHGLRMFRKHLKQYLSDMPMLTPYVERMLQTQDLAQLHDTLRAAEACMQANGSGGSSNGVTTLNAVNQELRPWVKRA